MARRMEVKTIEAFRFLRSLGIEPLLIKGWAAARNYPASIYRNYNDVDLVVSVRDFDSARSALVGGQGPSLGVDLHRELRHLDRKPWDSLVADAQLIDLDGYPIRVPCPEDHLRIMAVHWLNDGGERRDRLWDIYYAVANRPPDFDWDRCLCEVGHTRREWVLAAVGLAHRYLGLPLDKVPYADEAADLPPWVTATVEREWASGVALRPLGAVLDDPRELLRQVRKRVPPNPIQAMIEMEGSIRGGSRLRYQLGSMAQRVTPSLRRTLQRFKKWR